MQNKPKAELTAALMLLDTRSMSFDMREIDNCRFMFSPQAGELILGRQYTLKGIGISLGISTNLEVVTAQYVDVRLERKQRVLQTYHKALQPKTTVTGKEAGQETSKKAKKKSSEMEL